MKQSSAWRPPIRSLPRRRRAFAQVVPGAQGSAELGLNHAFSSRLSGRATAFWDRMKDPIANVTVSSTPSLITRQRNNLGQARIRGVSFEVPAAPELQGNLLPQVPRHRASLRLDYLHPEVLNASLRGRSESSRFDDDQNRLRLASLFVADLTLDRPLGASWVTAGLRFDLQQN